jgi:multisubunit Na+/H+ antiporter MnhF subunit
MNMWLAAATILIVGLIPCAVVCFGAPPVDRLVALELAANIDALIFLVLAQGLNRDVYFDLAIALALLSLAGALVFTHFMERWV